MPIVTLPLLSRRGFIATGAALLPLRAAAGAEARWALFSDTHIPANASESYRGFQPVANLTTAVRQAARTKPEGVLLCGDVARLEGKLEDYEAVKPLIAPLMETAPFAMAMGNHDNRDNFWKGFGAQKDMEPVKNRHVVVLDPGPVRFVVLDSLIATNTTPGLLGKVQRAWLSDWLPKNTGKPVIVFVHHTLDDGDGALLDAPRLLDILKGAPAVKAIIFGHSHVYRYDTWEGVHLINLPAIGYNFRDSDPVGWVESVFTAKGGQFTLRAIGGNMEKDGQTTRLAWRS